MALRLLTEGAEASTTMIPHLPYQRPVTKTPAASRSTRVVDLHSQLEDILDAVWQAEANWRFDDRLDMALKTRRSSFRS